VQILEEADIMCAPVQSLDAAIEDPQVLHNNMVIELDHPPHGKIKIAGVPVKLSETPGQVRTPAPSIGQDTVGILEQAGYSATEIAELRRRRIVAGGEPVVTGGG
ncbi:MAG: CoA transferase, partial [bacterium]